MIKMIKIKKTFSLISLFLISITLETVQPVDANEELLTLDMSVHEALANNWVIKAQEDAIQKSIYINNQSEADRRPTFSTSYGYTRLGEINTSRSGITPFKTIDLNTRNNYLWTTTISQPIFTGYALLSANELAKLGIDLEKINLEMEKLNLALQVKQAYFNILKADKALEVAKSAAESLESHVDVAKNYVEAGMSPVNDQLKAEVELANALQQIVRAQNLSQLNRASLNKLLSRPINNPVNIQDILLFDSISPDYDEYLARALENRPEVKAINISSFQADQRIRMAKSRYYPQAGLSASYSRAGDDPFVSGSRFHDESSWQAMASLTWIFWDWGKVKNSVNEVESLKQQLIKSRKILEDNIGLDLKAAILDLEATEKNIPTTKKAIEQAMENLRVSRERYEAQMTTSTEVLDAQTLLSRARVNYYNALYNHNLAKASLLKSIGEY